MSLMNVPIQTIYNGVSRQPPSVRLQNQVQDALNCSFSVETGGFEKRNGTTLGSRVAGANLEGGVKTHFIFRDSEERYAITVSDAGTLRVQSLVDNTPRTVNVNSDASSYLAGTPASQFEFTSIADYTVVLNKTTVVAKDTTTLAPAGVHAAVIDIRQSYGTYIVYINGTAVVTYTVDSADATPPAGEGLASDSATVTAAQIVALLEAAALPNFVIAQSSNYIFITNAVSDFTIDLETGGGYGILTKDSLQDTTDLPALAVGGMVVKLSSTAKAGYYLMFQESTSVPHTGIWVETTEPGSMIGFDLSTMPHILVRNADSTFTFSRAAWNPRTVGDDVTCPYPSFVGQTISDTVFFRDRLILTAGETEFNGATGDYFNMWPQYTTQVLDSDPFGLTCSANTVSLVRYAVPFRKSLFLTSDLNQFEMSTPDLFTVAKSSLTLSTSYPLSADVRPLAVGDSIYMVSNIGDYAAVLEYDYDFNTDTDTASDIIKHAHGYLPGNIAIAAGDAITDTLMFVSGTSNMVYVYQFYFSGNDRTQSAWHQWSFPSVQNIWGLGFINGTVWIVAGMADGAIHYLNMNLGRSVAAGHPWRLVMDQMVSQVGTYSSITGLTSWTLPYVPPAGTVVALEPTTDFGTAGGIPTATTSGATVTAPGDWSTHPMLIGITYLSNCEFSKQYAKDTDKSSLLDGRCQMRQMVLGYVDTGAFDVTVTPEGRTPRVSSFTGRTLGRADNLPGSQPIRTGSFRFLVTSRSDTVTIAVSNSSQLPFTIVNATWSGFYNSISR